ncbi:MAG: hypothetical protein RSD04_04160 [Clostridia bacterium]
MEVELVFTVAIYVLTLLAESILSSLKNAIFGLILPIATSIIFMITKNESLYQLLFWQTIVFMITKALFLIIKAINGRKKNSKIDKSKIKDL